MRIDIHSHVLPKVDDGAKDWDMCLEMLKKSAECGIEAVIATPHYLPHRRGTPIEKIKELCERAQEKLQTKMGITMDIYAGHEIYYSVGVVEQLKKGEILTLAGSRYVLVEFHPSVSYSVISSAIRSFREAGYVPILAHVERYSCLCQQERIKEAKESGALLQMNVGTLQGGLFDVESRFGKKLLLQGDIDFLSSDMHNLDRRPPMAPEQLKWLDKKISQEYSERLLGVHAKQWILK